MPSPFERETTKRRPINLTIRTDVLKEAKSLNLNASQAAEAGIIAAIQRAQEQEWLHTNKTALLAHNNRIEQEGLLLTPSWVKK